MHDQRIRRTGSPDGVRTPKGSARAFFDYALSSRDKEKCLIWPYAVGTKGYPKVTIDWVKYNGHSRMCELVHGPKPSPEYQAAHSCGNKRCINPHHLRWATPLENAADSMRLGVLVRGEEQHASKLTEDQVRAIRRMGEGSLTHGQIGEVFGVSSAAVWSILHKKTWAWLDAEQDAA